MISRVKKAIYTHKMSDKATENVVPVTEAPKDAPAAAEGEKGPSKAALKKAAKEKEKVGGIPNTL